MTRVDHRVSQFLRAASSRPAAGDQALIDRHLPACLQPPFARLDQPEQTHAVAVLRSLLKQGYTDPDLLAAALVHDLGKSLAPLRLMDRVIVVLGHAIFPRRAARWSHGEPSGWHRPFVVAAHHAAWGEALVLRAGGSASLAELVRRHHDRIPVAATPAERLLQALQAADGGH